MLLSTAFCGSSLRLGTIIIAWIQIVLNILFILIFVPVVALGTAVFTDKVKQNRLKESDDPWKTTGFDPSSDDMWTHTGTKQKSDKEQTEVFVGVGAALAVFLLVVLIIQYTSIILLLVGAHKRRPGFLILWLVLSVFSLFGLFHSMDLVGIIFGIINMYFIWVVFSFYRQLKDEQNPMTQPAPRDVKLQGDNVPHVPTQFIPDAPPAYAYTQKEF